MFLVNLGHRTTFSFRADHREGIRAAREHLRLVLATARRLRAMTILAAQSTNQMRALTKAAERKAETLRKEWAAATTKAEPATEIEGGGDKGKAGRKGGKGFYGSGSMKRRPTPVKVAAVRRALWVAELGRVWELFAVSLARWRSSSWRGFAR